MAIDGKLIKKIEAEYISSESKISIAKLAEKYKIPERTLFKYTSENKWIEKRQKFCSQLAEKTVQKVDQKIEQLAEKNAEAITKRNQIILELNDKAIDAWNKYFDNQDYSKHLCETTEPYKDKDGNIVFDKKGRPIMIKSVKVMKVPYIIAPMLNFATNGINKANTTSRLNEGLSTENQKQSGKVEHEVSLTSKEIEDELDELIEIRSRINAKQRKTTETEGSNQDKQEESS